MYGMTQEEGRQRLTNFLATLRQKKFTSPNARLFYITCSVGMAQYPDDGKDLQILYRTADRVLRQVKKAGGDGVGME
jgi:GGDEF domain-containing protein